MTLPTSPTERGLLLVLTFAALGLWGYNASLIARGVSAPADDAPASLPPPVTTDRLVFEASYPDPFVPDVAPRSETAGVSPYASGYAPPAGGFSPSAASTPASFGSAPPDVAYEPEPAWEPEPYAEPPPALALRGVVGRRALVADPRGRVHLLAPGDTLAGATLRFVRDGTASFTHAGDPFTLAL